MLRGERAVMSPLPVLVGPLYMLGAIALIMVLLAKNKLNDRIAMLVLGASVLVAGLLQGGILDTTIYLHEVLFNAWNSLAVNPQQALKVSLILASFLAVGRLFCGYVCPLGAAQELISKLVKKQVRIDARISEQVRLAVFACFIVFGILLPSLVHFNPFQIVAPQLGLFKLSAFLIISAAAIFVYRPWCTLLCPFGAVGNLLSRVSIFKLRAGENCNGCSACTRACPTGQPPAGSMAECYYCGRCLKACKKNALYLNMANSTITNKPLHETVGP